MACTSKPLRKMDKLVKAAERKGQEKVNLPIKDGRGKILKAWNWTDFSRTKVNNLKSYGRLNPTVKFKKFVKEQNRKGPMRQLAMDLGLEF